MMPEHPDDRLSVRCLRPSNVSSWSGPYTESAMALPSRAHARDERTESQVSGMAHPGKPRGAWARSWTLDRRCVCVHM
eukprot:9492578-Pyramimonas_sp.AAC.1